MNLAQHASQSSSDGALGGLGIFLFCVVLIASVAMYMLPTIIAMVRKVPNLGSVFVVDFFLAWTGIGWVVALAMAMRSRPQLVPQQYGAYPPAR